MAARCRVPVDGDELHVAGLEVILDVVYNHTGEGNELGPTVAFAASTTRPTTGLSKARPAPILRRHRHRQQPQRAPLRKRYDPSWIRCATGSPKCTWTDFASDLAATLARQVTARRRLGLPGRRTPRPHSCPRLGLIAEPWDVGQLDSYDVGRFPAGWSEWNGKYRDTVRDFWRSTDGLLAEFATRVSGSADLYGMTRRQPTASVNLVTTHDGFTLRDR